MFTELYREEKREEGDRSGQEDKGGNPLSSSFLLPPLSSFLLRRETDPASNQFPKCSPPSRTHKEFHRVGSRREGGRRRYRRPGGEKGESKGGESNPASNLTPK